MTSSATKRLPRTTLLWCAWSHVNVRTKSLRHLRDASRRPGGAEGVHLLLDVREIDVDQLVQLLEERAGLRFGGGELLAMRRGRRLRRRETVDGGVHAVEQRRERRLVVAAQDRVAVELIVDVVQRRVDAVHLRDQLRIGTGDLVERLADVLHPRGRS